MCDTSSSMGDTDYNTMMEGIKVLLGQRKAGTDSAGDTYSIVLFTNEAKYKLWEIPVTKDFIAPARE